MAPPIFSADWSDFHRTRFDRLSGHPIAFHVIQATKKKLQVRVLPGGLWTQILASGLNDQSFEPRSEHKPVSLHQSKVKCRYFWPTSLVGSSPISF